VGPLFALVFLIYPILVVLSEDPAPTRVLITLAGAALFACGFLWLMWLHRPLPLVPTEQSVVLERRAALVLLTLVVVGLNFATGSDWRVLLFHINVAAGILLPRRDAYLAIAVLALVNLGLSINWGLAWLVFPTVALGLWATAFVSQIATVAELRAAREELAQHAVAEERLRFARDLHDLLGHSLSLITLKTELAGKLLPANPDEAAKEIRDAEEVARRALREVREAVAGYRQPTLGDEVIGAEEMLLAAGISCRIENGAGHLPKPLDSLLAWAVREGTTNVIRHSRARHCVIRLERTEGRVRVEVGDDGAGLRPGAAASGSGLSGLAERVADVSGAEFEAGPRAEGGFSLRVTLPYQDNMA
jgi:two-component system sensor histidine kinase DesK